GTGRVRRREHRQLATGTLGALALLLVIGVVLPLGAARRSVSLPVAATPPPGPPPTVRVLKLTGVVDPFVAGYIEHGIEAAGSHGDAAVLLAIDTPGGLDSSMRGIVRAILAARVPVVCWTAPAGARAASA